MQARGKGGGGFQAPLPALFSASIEYALTQKPCTVYGSLVTVVLVNITTRIYAIPKIHAETIFNILVNLRLFDYFR